MQSFLAELKTRYEDAKICVHDFKDEIVQTQGHILMVMKKKENFERQIVDAMELIVGIQDHVASLNPSIHQCEASNKAKGCRISVVVKTQLGQTIISPAMQPESRLLKEVKTEIEDVALDIIQGCTGETVVQGTDLSNQSTCNIDVNFLQ
ncbi:hypothetical protein K7X08_026322 [Anisodus acutangulus]|uniref:Uncharacterized protein n=1 Tax=Anisodus acutangulus TaxID=402998 RepID=A0A9Q1R2U3_9SOLA|nr:hypothetical protein K7X08_026322 [Anisodus acutangulus]